MRKSILHKKMVFFSWFFFIHLGLFHSNRQLVKTICFRDVWFVEENQDFTFILIVSQKFIVILQVARFWRFFEKYLFFSMGPSWSWVGINFFDDVTCIPDLRNRNWTRQVAAKVSSRCVYRRYTFANMKFFTIFRNFSQKNQFLRWNFFSEERARYGVSFDVDMKVITAFLSKLW